MNVLSALSRRCAVVLTALCASLASPGLMAQDAPVAASASGGLVPAMNMADKQCSAYGNVKPSFSAENGRPFLQLAYGSGDGLFGGAWFPVPAPEIQSEQCRGILLSLRGNGHRPGRSYLFIRDGKNGTYRSKEITPAYKLKEWTDLLLTADDFIPDPDSKTEVTRNLPKKPDFSTIERMDFSAVNLDAEPVLEIRSIAFDMGAGSGLTLEQLAAKVSSADAPPADVVFLPNAGPLTPTPKKVDFPAGTWWQRHQGFVARAKQGDVDLLWLGDSITDNWNKFKGTYRQLYPNVKAANFGIGGDGTQNLLWRLENGELDGITPKVAVVLIGTNNVQWNESAQISAAIERIVSTIRTKSPTTKVLLLAIFPRGDLAANSPGPKRIQEVNASISKLDDGQNVRYLDISSKLTNPDGTILQEAFADKVHLSPKGFTIWAQSMQPLLDEMMK